MTRPRNCVASIQILALSVDEVDQAPSPDGLQLPHLHIRRALLDAELAIEDHHTHYVQVHGVASLLLHHIDLSLGIALAEGAALERGHVFVSMEPLHQKKLTASQPSPFDDRPGSGHMPLAICPKQVDVPDDCL